jgi:hypothetical protein
MRDDALADRNPCRLERFSMMTACNPPSGSVEPHPSQQSLRGLDWFNFFLPGVLTGFGPFVSLRLAKQSWTKEDVGFVQTISVIAGLLV